ncbi:MAG TPA: hypothetical protein VMV27_02980 [Candidatus Binataceae bacterium]|nr:hypothetical protein [Candidatus Binataceae bacterium]
MSEPEMSDEPEKMNGAEATDNDSVASKLSQELSNWRRKRTSSRPARPDGLAASSHSEPARTIKVRGHETLVVRKPKLAPKPPSNPRASEQ